MGSAKAPQAAGGEQSRRSLRALAGQRWPCPCCPQGGSFALWGWGCSDPSGKDVGRWGCVCSGCWVPSLCSQEFLHYPQPFHLLLLSLSSRSSSHTPPLSSSPGPHIPTHCRPFRPQQLFQRHPRGPRGSSPPNQTQICSLYANMMCVDAEALLAHTASKQKHMAEPEEAGLRALGRDLKQIWGGI